MTAPLSRAIAGVAASARYYATNEERLAHPVLAPVLSGLPGNSFGPMDWRELYDFLFQVLDYTDMMPQPHDEICQFIAAQFPDLSFKSSEQHFGMCLVPRNCFKTVIFSIGLPLFLLWKNPNSRGLLSAHRHDAAKQKLTTIKWHIENNNKFKMLCGEWKPKFKESKWAEDAIIITGRTVAMVDPSIDTCGVDRSKVGAHPDWIIPDDVHSESNVNTAVMRNKVLDHLINMNPMLQPGGTMLVVGTRWHHADAYGKLLSLDEKATLDGVPAQYNTLIRSAYIETLDPKVKLLYFPTRLTEDFLMKARYRYGKTKFSLWFLNKPIDDDDRLFPKEQLYQTKLTYFYDQDMGVPSIMADGNVYPVNVGMAWDPAGIHPSDKSDFHGLSIVGCDEHNRWLIPAAEAIKAKPDAVLRRVAGYCIMYQPEYLIIENVGQSGTWAYMLRTYMEREGIHCPPLILHTPNTKVDKNTRIETMQPKFVAHEIIVDSKCRELIDQFDNFPQLDFDDLLDSVQMHTDYARPPDPQGQDLLTDYDFLTSEEEKGEDDRRKRLGAYAGRSSSKWKSLVKT